MGIDCSWPAAFTFTGCRPGSFTTRNRCCFSIKPLKSVGHDIQKLERELASIEEELILRQRERDAVVVNIGDRLLRTYEKMRKKNRGLGVVGVVKGA